jgi:diketogulonate reductase-like aldo/keto reductase
MMGAVVATFSCSTDPFPPDSIGALAELKDSGKVRHIGVWTFTVAQLKRARASVTQWIG